MTTTGAVDVVSAADVLRKAQQLLVGHGWSRVDVGGQLSVYSAVSLAMFGKTLAHLVEAEFVALDPVLQYFSDAIGGLPRIADWELEKHRTAVDVYEAFARAIHAAAWQADDSPPEAA
jgi:hypothetical protein